MAETSHMKVLHIDCSPRLVSHSRRMSAAIVGAIRERHPEAEIVRRDLGAAPLPHATSDYANTLSSPTTLAAPLSGSLELSEILIQELEAAGAVVIGTPMHNLTVPSAFKAWIDQIMRAGRTFTTTRAGKEGLLSDRPVFVAIASGGTFQRERSWQPDFLTPYLTAIFSSIGIHSVQFFALQATAFLDKDSAPAAQAKVLAALDLSSIEQPQTV
jgi:FMN-dependent NADH-azoreductase